MATTVEVMNLLVIEDDLSEQKLIKMMINNSNYHFATKFISDGESALEYFNDFPESESVFRKIHLILLDLNIPKVNGLEVLRSIRRNQTLKFAPVVVLTTSNNKNDISDAYGAGAYGYVRKPSTIDEYENVIKRVLDYWFNCCIIN